ncbi:hypothetical protein COBT_001647 [Conglomerata obtusa]
MTENNNSNENNDSLRKKHKLITKETILNFIRLIQNETNPKTIQEIISISKSTFKKLRKNYENNLYNNLSDFKNQNEKKLEKRKINDIESAIIAIELALNSSMTLGNISNKLYNSNISANQSKWYRCRLLYYVVGRIDRFLPARGFDI